MNHHENSAEAEGFWYENIEWPVLVKNLGFYIDGLEISIKVNNSNNIRELSYKRQMAYLHIITVLTLLLAGTSVHPQSNDVSSSTIERPLENLKSLTDQFNFLDYGHPEDSSIHEFDQIDLNQLLNSYTVYPSLEFNLTNQIRSANRNKSVIVWGGVVPFFSIPDPDQVGQESSFATENFSIFWHLKKRF